MEPVKAETGKPDRFTRIITEAMCGTGRERADAISTIAEDGEINGYPDDVYSLARDLADKGCPQAKP